MTREATAVRSPWTATRESLHTAMTTQLRQIHKYKKQNKQTNKKQIHEGKKLVTELGYESRTFRPQNQTSSPLPCCGPADLTELLWSRSHTEIWNLSTKRRNTAVWIKGNVKVAQLCLTLWDPMDYIVHGILQARIMEWVAFPFSRWSSQPRDWTQVSCIAGRFFTSWATGWTLLSTAWFSSLTA